jgi:membrane protease YdiL (CAAX protease family)
MIAAWLHAALVVFLVLVFPVWDRYETRRLKRDPSPAARVRVYRTTILWLWAATVLLLLTTSRADLFTPPRAASLGFLARDPDAAAGIVSGIAAGVLIGALLPALLALANAGAREKLLKQLGTISFFLPRGGRERLYFAALSLSAGVCEEVIFRGFLIRYFDGLFGHPLLVWPILAAALVFGLDHGYQGWAGMLLTTVMALVLSALYYGFGALWLPMLLHALIDLRILLILPRRGLEAAEPASAS